MNTIRALLIDPFQKRVHEIQVGDHIKDWHKWCDCQLFDHAYIGTHQGQRQDIWVDDEGLNRYPMYPTFKWTDRQDPLIGYGLLLATTADGESVSTRMPIEHALAHIQWEKWEDRLKPEDFFDQLTRLYFKHE